MFLCILQKRNLEQRSALAVIQIFLSLPMNTEHNSKDERWFVSFHALSCLANRTTTRLSDISEEARGVLQGSGNKKGGQPRWTRSKVSDTTSFGHKWFSPASSSAKKKKKLLPDGRKLSTLDGEQMCVVWHEAWCLCSLCWHAQELLCVGFSSESATSCRSLIYRCILMFSVLAGRPACSPTPPPSVCLCRWFLLFRGEVTAMRGLWHVAFWERPPPKCLHVSVCARVCVPAP